jgi:hypothetical protein
VRKPCGFGKPSASAIFFTLAPFRMLGDDKGFGTSRMGTVDGRNGRWARPVIIPFAGPHVTSRLFPISLHNGDGMCGRTPTSRLLIGRLELLPVGL